MSQYSHSIVLFSGDDGLPIDFNIQYVVEKTPLKAMIEHGGGSWTLIDSDDAIYLVSPGTKFINVRVGKKLISSRYIFDCVKQNFLLDMKDYKIEITEVETSDFSEDNSLKLTENEVYEDRKLSDGSNSSVDIIDTSKTVSPHLLDCPVSNHAFDFQDTEFRNDVRLHKKGSDSASSFVPMKTVDSHEIILDNFAEELTKSRISEELPSNANKNDVTDDYIHVHEENINFDAPTIHEPNLDASQEILIQPNVKEQLENHKDEANSSLKHSLVDAVIVSSSQPNVNSFDSFDNGLLNKSLEKSAKKDEGDLSQSYTVSSSADAQVPSNPAVQDTSADIFGETAAMPDSASQTTEREQYIKDLENEVEQILSKPQPITIEDKTSLVKYVCAVKKLAPAEALHILQNYKI